MRAVLGDAKQALDHRRHPLTSPDLPDEAKGFRATGQSCLKFHELGWGQAWLGSRRRVPPQAFHAPSTTAFEPLADGTRTHTEGHSTILLFPALLVQRPCTQATAFAPVGWLQSLYLRHARSLPQDKLFV